MIISISNYQWRTGFVLKSKNVYHEKDKKQSAIHLSEY